MKRAFLNCNTRWGVCVADLELPVFYHDKSSINAVYTASTSLVKRYLPDPMMHPLEASPGRCLVSFSAFEYRMTNIGVFNEFRIAFIISYGKKNTSEISPHSLKRKKCIEMYIRHLPVTTEAARIGGVETYGFPKILTEIIFCRENGITKCIVSDNKRHILTLFVPELRTKPGNVIRHRTYTNHQGMTLRSNIYTKNHEFAESTKTGYVDLLIGDDHDICRELRSIDLSQDALMCQYIPSSESILSIPRSSLRI